MKEAQYQGCFYYEKERIEIYQDLLPEALDFGET